MCQPRRPSPPSSALAARPAGTMGTGCGGFGAFWTCLVGGVGLRRGRRDAVDLRVGEALDFWRVEAFEPGHLLRLQAEMKLPGRAWLEFEVTAGRGRLHNPADGHLRSVGLARPGLLVRPVSFASHDLRRYASGLGPGRGRRGPKTGFRRRATSPQTRLTRTASSNNVSRCARRR